MPLLPLLEQCTRFQGSYAPQIPGPHFGQFIVNTPSSKATVQLVKEFQKKYIHYFPGTYVRVRQLDYSMLTDNEVEVRLIGEDKDALIQLADSLQHVIAGIPYVANVRSDFGGYQYGLNLQADPEAARTGISPVAVFESGIQVCRNTCYFPYTGWKEYSGGTAY